MGGESLRRPYSWLIYVGLAQSVEQQTRDWYSWYYAASRYALMRHEFKAHIAHHVNLWVVGSSPTSDAKEDPCAVIHTL